MEKSEKFLSSETFNKRIFNLDSGRIPPQALDLEEAVLGAMLIDKKGVDEVIDILQKDAFYKESHKNIFEAIYSLFQSSEPVDLLTVSTKLRKMGVLEKVGGDFYLVQLSKKFQPLLILNFMLELFFKNLFKDP